MADINLLRPKTKALCELLIKKCKEQGIDIIITQTYGSIELQNAYYSQGRESLASVNSKRKSVGLTPIKESENKIITKAVGGSSPHNYSLAFDICPVKNGVAQWNDIATFKKVGEISKLLNVEGYTLEWGGNFKNILDYPHFQMKGWKNYK